nr:WecB/TagA/CpsF family glycosyltransferase [Novosphingobium piscinae]
MTEPARLPFLGLSFDDIDPAAAHQWILAHAGDRPFRFVVTPNVDHMVRLHRDADPALWEIYRGADLLLCDSRILAALARRSGIELPVVAGSDLTALLLGQPLPDGLRIALIGGDAGQRRWLEAAQPGIRIDQFEPPMQLRRKPEAQLATAEFIEAHQPDITLFTVGAPQSEIVAHLVKQRGMAGGVALCVGASLEFLTGEKRRAPRWMQQLSLEWAFRLGSEPRRLWRRYLVEGPAIFAIWWRWRRQRD